MDRPLRDGPNSGSLQVLQSAPSPTHAGVVALRMYRLHGCGSRQDVMGSASGARGGRRVDAAPRALGERTFGAVGLGACGPERIDPGDLRSPQAGTPREVGGLTEVCSMTSSQGRNRS